MSAVAERGGGPGRPKDLEKRAAILAAAKHLFPQNGFEGTSMDAVATEAGVSKLTVYSHFGGKEALFAEVVHCKCDERLPRALFEFDAAKPLRAQLLRFAHAFFDVMMSTEALGMHRTLVASAQSSPKLARVFWEAGPVQVRAAFAGTLREEVAMHRLAIDDCERAASQFFALLKGEHHARMLFGCGVPDAAEAEAHVTATVDVFLRAYQCHRP